MEQIQKLIQNTRVLNINSTSDFKLRELVPKYDAKHDNPIEFINSVQRG